MKNMIKSGCLIAMVLLFSSAVAGSSRGVDARITTRISSYIAHHAEYSLVRFNVDDATVFLNGSVQLESQRRTLIQEVRALPEVAGVRANVVLDPPPLRDEVLYPRVLKRLESVHLPLHVTVHQGLVTIKGSVPTQRDLQRILTIVHGIEGVSEVVSELRVMGGH